jgi:hypothetical protein
MNAPELVRVADVAELLRAAGYEVATRELAGREAVLGETPYALVACVEFDDWSDLDERVFDVQAALTQVAAEVPSPRAWDLYLVVLVLRRAQEAAQRAQAEAIEADTRYARKFVRIAIAKDELDRALRPLLPLREPVGLEIRDPLNELRGELRALGIADDIADAAINTFQQTDTVEVL